MNDDMIGLEARIGYFPEDGYFYVQIVNIEDELDGFEEGPFGTREEAETWVIEFMESQGGICMGRMDDTKH